MASRYTSTKVLTRCFNPVSVFHHGKQFTVPCGRCSACLLDKANKWSMRVSAEIDACPYPIFFTLTYDNSYVPKAVVEYAGDLGWRVSSHFLNFRYNSVCDVKRHDFEPFYVDHDISKDIPIQHYGDGYFAYASKEDVIKWIKLLKQDIYERFGLRGAFRHYVISEYGPTTYRPHYHGVLFCTRKEVAEYLLRVSMYQNWQMCDKSLFDKYTHYCDSGCSGYVTQYLTCYSDLPTVLKEKCFKPFRLASKVPAIGFSSFDKTEVFENLYQGIITYSRRVARIEQEPILVYPKEYCSRLFPKCYKFMLLDFTGLLKVYGLLFREVRAGFEYDRVCCRLRETLNPLDWQATKTCYRFCVEYGTVPMNYLYLLDMYYYKSDMLALKSFYEWQQSAPPVSIAFSYTNFVERIKAYQVSDDFDNYSIELFCEQLGFSAYELQQKSSDSLVFQDLQKNTFCKEVDDIVNNMCKLPKYNELNGSAPHII